MFCIIKEKLRRFIWIVAGLNLIFISTAYGQTFTVFGRGGDPDVNPFADTSRYSEDFYEITDDGVKNADGEYIDFVDEDTLYDSGLYEIEEEPDSFEDYRETILANWGDKKSFTEERLKGLGKNLDEAKSTFNLLDTDIKDLEEKIRPLQKEIAGLKDQIGLIDANLEISKKKIKSVELRIAEKKLRLSDLMRDLKYSEAALNAQRQTVLDFIRLVYEEEEKFVDQINDKSSTFKLLLADNSIGENLQGRDYLSVLEETSREVFYDLKEKQDAIDEKKYYIQLERDSLDALYEALDNERKILEESRKSKELLLKDSEGREELYQRLLEESIKQQLESAVSIQNISDSIEFIEDKLDYLDFSLEEAENFENDPENIAELEAMNAEGQYIQAEIEQELSGNIESIPRFQAFVWPVPPIAVTAYFEDPTYPKKWGIHKAVDLRAPQYTEIIAPANAYVFQTKDNGMGYSYIILAHKNKLVTVYGHVSEMKVKAGAVVRQGDVIGLTGGTPGTKGAGWQTTGSHLHFEVWHNGSQVDPLGYLPVHELPIEYIPDEYLELE